MAATFPIYPAHTAVLSMDCQAGIVSIYAKDDKNASAVSDAPHSTRVVSSGKFCGARPIQPFEGSPSWVGVYANSMALGL